MNFSEWLISELERRGWSRSEAARRGGISSSMIDKVINGYSKPGIRFLEGIAQAFGITLAEVVTHSDQNNLPPRKTLADSLYNSLSPENQQKALEDLEFLRLQEENETRRERSARKPRTSETT